MLIVDDCSETREQYRLALLAGTVASYEFLEAVSGSQGLEVLRTHTVDGIILNFQLPDLNGLGFLTKIKAEIHNPPPVVIMADDRSVAIAVQAMKQGATDYLIKQETSADQLRISLQSAMSKKVSPISLPSDIAAQTGDPLQDSLRLLQQIAETTPGILYLYDLSEQRNIYANRQTGELLGYSTEQIQAMGSNLLSTLIHSDDWASIPLHFDRLQQAPDGTVLELEYRMQHANGEWRWFLGREVLFDRLPDGQIHQILGITQDITSRKQTELELTRAIARFEQAAYAVNCLIYEWDFLTDAVDRTRGLTELLGYDLEDAEPTKEWWGRLAHPDDVARMQEQPSDLSSIDRYSIEYRVRHKQGHYCWVHDQGIIVKNEAGQPIKAVGSTTDISDRKRAEESLLASETRLKSFMDANVVGILFGDVEGGIQQANDEFLRIVGYSRDDLVTGKLRWSDITPPEYLPLDELGIAEAQSRGACTPYEKEYIRKDGSRISVLVGYSLLGESRQDSIAFILDITQSKQTDLALRQSEEHYRYLAEVIPHLVWTCNPAGLWTYVNQQFCDYTGLTQKQALGLGWLTAVHPDDMQYTYEVWTAAVDQGQPYTHEYRLKQQADGIYRWHTAQGLPLKNAQGHVIKWFGTCTDIHDQKQLADERAHLLELEQTARVVAEDANRAKDEFLAIVSHELRSPINSILGWANLLRTRSLDPTILPRALEVIERNARSQSQLIEDLLDVSRIVYGKLQITVAPVQLASVIQAALEVVRPMAEAKSIQITCTQTTDQSGEGKNYPLLQVLGDFNRLQQIVLNLLSNAIKFTPHAGHVNVNLKAVGKNPSSEPHAISCPAYAQLTVTDTGKGINPEFIPYVFDRFRQANTGTTKSYEGLGLGLAIVQHLLELHGGSITAASNGEGQGAAFTIVLPLLENDDVDIEGQSNKNYAFPTLNPPSTSNLPLAGISVLIVDDQADACEFAMIALEQAGADVAAVSSSQRALQALNTHKVDILVSDISMPAEDGYTLLRRVRLLPADQGGAIPAIALTANSLDEDRDKALAAGFQLHISKPVEPDYLVALIVSLTR
ncbi:PAS domain S-box protein [Leptolyngbyaceae cyanobacterium UHCC 1019]